MKYTLGLDIGGTTIKGGIVTPRGNVIKTVSVPTQAKRGREYFLKNINRVITLLGAHTVSAIGVGCPGALDPYRGIVQTPHNIPLRYFPLRDYLHKKYHRRVVLDNDANAFTLAEAVFGAGKNYRMVVGLTLGTGVGGGIVINRTIEHGRGNAGELGHMTIAMNGLRGNDGHIGCLEEYLRGEPMKKLRRKLGLASYSSKDLRALARQRKRAAIAYWKVFGMYCGVGCASIIRALDPNIIVLGGKISKAFPYFRCTLLKAITEHTNVSPPPIHRAKLGDHAGIIGAALLTQSQKQKIKET